MINVIDAAIAWSLVVTAITMTAAIFLLCVSRIQLRHMHHIAKKKLNKPLPVSTDATPGSPSDCAGTCVARPCYFFWALLTVANCPR